MIVKELGLDDLNDVAELHLAAFPKAAISRLGRESARRFYESLLRGPHEAVALGVIDGTALVGYIFAGVWRDAEIHFLRTNVAWIGVRVMSRPSLLWSPLFRGRARAALRLLSPWRRKSATARDTDASLGRYFGIQSVAVHPSAQGRGAGRLLMEAAERVAKERSFSRMGLSVHSDNVRAIRLYEGAGWTRLLVNGRWHGVMVKELT